jgi:hypothetical protein
MTAERLVTAGLDLLNEAFGIFDAELRLVACNRGFVELHHYPDGLCRPGTPFEAMLRFQAEVAISARATSMTGSASA